MATQFIDRVLHYHSGGVEETCRSLKSQVVLQEWSFQVGVSAKHVLWAQMALIVIGRLDVWAEFSLTLIGRNDMSRGAT